MLGTHTIEQSSIGNLHYRKLVHVLCFCSRISSIAHLQVGLADFEPMSMLILVSDAFSLEDDRVAIPPPSSDNRLGRLAGERSGKATLFGPLDRDIFLLDADNIVLSPVLSRDLGDSCGIILERRRGLSIRKGPMADFRLPLLLAPTIFGVPGMRFAGLLGAFEILTASELLPLLEAVGDGALFILRFDKGDTRKGDDCSSSVSVRLPSADPPERERDLKNPGFK